MTASSWLLPDVEDPTAAAFWEGTARGELLVQACGACGKRRMPPRPMCPACQSTAVTWEATSGRGRIWSYIVPHPPLLPAYAEVAPYNAIIVELEEDPMIRFAGNLVTSADGPINEIDPATIAIGEPVRVVFAPVEDVFLPRWVRA
ncbi:MAG: Zn-ribbon domain-containing OB-fold protein [Acidimicrobiia bacterium]